MEPMLNRWFFLCLPLLFTACASQPMHLESVRVYNKSTEDFTRISEYFTGEENAHGYRLVLRTNPDQRAGVYFAASFSDDLSSLPDGSIAILDILFEDQDDIRSYSFPLPEDRSGKRVLYLGLTGQNEPKNPKQIMAWKMRIIDASKQTMIEKESYLWRMPKE